MDSQASVRAEHCQETLLPSFKTLYEESSQTDVVLKCSNGIVRSFKILLAGCSPLLRSAFDTELESDLVVLEDVTTEEVHTFHQCLLSSEVTNLDRGVFEFLGINLSPFLTPLSDVNQEVPMDTKLVQPIAEENPDAIVPDKNEIDVENDDENYIVSTPKLKKAVKYCNVCGKTYLNEESFKKHYLQHLKDAELDQNKENDNEEDTGVDGEEKRSTRRPKRNTNKPKRYEDMAQDLITGTAAIHSCSYCGDEFQTGAEVHNHILQDHADVIKKKMPSKFYCEECDKGFATAATLKNHQLAHKGETPFECDICHRRFTTSSSLTNHKRLHDNKSVVKCPHCSRPFNNPSNLIRHVRALHFEFSDKKKFLCTDCGKNFKDPSGLAAHRKIHTGVRSYMCHECNRSFLTKAQLRVHERIHTGERPFMCKKCGRQFTTNGQLKSHIQHKHVGVVLSKEHLCPECGVSFVKAHDLKTHMYRHTGEKPFECSSCGKSFRSVRNLRDHFRTHSGEKPFRCDTCGKAFTAPAGLRQHFKCHDVCRANATEGAYSIKQNRHIKYARAKVEDSSEVLSEIEEEDLALDGTTVLGTQEQFETVVFVNQADLTLDTEDGGIIAVEEETLTLVEEDATTQQ